MWVVVLFASVVFGGLGLCLWDCLLLSTFDCVGIGICVLLLYVCFVVLFACMFVAC